MNGEGRQQRPRVVGRPPRRSVNAPLRQEAKEEQGNAVGARKRGVSEHELPVGQNSRDAQAGRTRPTVAPRSATACPGGLRSGAPSYRGTDKRPRVHGSNLRGVSLLRVSSGPLPPSTHAGNRHSIRVRISPTARTWEGVPPRDHSAGPLTPSGHVCTFLCPPNRLHR